MAKDADSPMAEGELPVIAKKAAAPKLHEQQRREIAREEIGDISREEEMAEEREQTSSATGAISGGTNPSNAWKQSKLARGEHLLHILRKLRHYPGGRKCGRNMRAFSSQ